MFDHFTVIPSIDLKFGEVVRLVQGDMARATVYGTDPAAIAKSFADEGAEQIHIVDLDGAIDGEPRNLGAIRAIRAAVSCPIDVSGGLRSLDSINEVIAAGADYIAIGSAAFLDPDLLNDACNRFPGRVFGSLDSRNGRLAIKGWVETSQLTVAEAALRFRQAGVAAIILTDIARDGTQAGANLGMFTATARLSGVPIIASGGIASLEDIRALRSLFDHGVAGAISGRALYEGRFTLTAARLML
ncbi:MAG TPA: 1-(5-phosphoribosyl)-5-[(5-phosphoribosylamino)methylideneamino]imidazole-4-carboxamide isomerase [Candidatus Binataceae bacterium]|nr:1-(5-phosphoribosyl)-5-[(5-phosphoribosylamino)methylideneamino]imidazole-4-carboxamide isomerase [Candidatus Binataceae bacterium]